MTPYKHFPHATTQIIYSNIWGGGGGLPFESWLPFGSAIEYHLINLIHIICDVISHCYELNTDYVIIFKIILDFKIQYIQGVSK